MFPIKQTGRNIMVSGRNGVRFPQRSCSSKVGDGFNSGFRRVYLHMSLPESVYLRLGCFHRSVVAESRTHPESGTEA